MPSPDESDYIPSSGEEEDARIAAARQTDNRRQHADNASSTSPSPQPQRTTNARQRRGRSIFRNKHGAPMCFFFGPGVQQSSKERLSQRIQDCGGQVVLTEEEADIVLVGPKYSDQDVQAKQASYYFSANTARRNIVVEKTSFVKSCIEDGKVSHKRKRGTMQGFRKDIGRTEFTTDDENHLCRFLWQATLDNGGGGRTGLKLYKRMVAMAEHATEHRWAERHPPESWRNRYKKNRERLDSIIDEIADEASEDVRQHFQKGGKVAGDEEESEDDGELEPESEEERPRQKRRTAAPIREPRRARRRARVASSSPPRASRSRLRRNVRKEKTHPESEEEVQEEEEEAEQEERYQEADSLFDGPYEELNFAGENTQATLVNLSTERREDLNRSGPSHSNSQRPQKPGLLSQNVPVPEQVSPPRPKLPSQLPRKAARRPRPPIPSSPPDEEQEAIIPQSSPTGHPELFGSSPVRRQQDRSRIRDVSRSPTPRTTDTPRVHSERPQPFASRRLTLPRPIVANPPPSQASSSKVQLRQSIPQGRPAQGIYPVISPSHHIVPAMSTPVRRGSVSSFDSEDSNFPIPGTKADSMKKYLREEHKRTPYTAAPGTRAAAYLSQGM